MAELEGPDEYIPLRRAAELAGLSVNTLQHQALRSRLQTIKPAHDRFTTRRWLHQYLKTRRVGEIAPLPAGYVTPDGEEPIS